MNYQPLVSVIIVSYNTRKLTVKSLKSVFASKGFTKDQLEVIIVDNHSPDDTAAYVRVHFPLVKLIVNHKNKGYGGANNQGARLAKGKYLLLLNSDAFLSPDSLRLLVDVLDKQTDVISVGPQLRYADGRIQLSGGYLPTPLRVMAWMFWLDKLPLIKNFFSKPYHVINPTWHTKEQSPDWLMGACTMFRREEFLAVGGFDEQIFMYTEEVELYHRLKERFHKLVLYTPKTKVVHLGRASGNKADPQVLTHELEGIKQFYRKHYSHLLWLAKLVIFNGVLLRLAVFSSIPSRSEATKEYRSYLVKR